MNLNSAHQKDQGNNFFGMLDNRLLFRGPSQRPASEAAAEKAEAGKQGPEDELKQEYLALRLSIPDFAEKYNQAYPQDKIVVDMTKSGASLKGIQSSGRELARKINAETNKDRVTALRKQLELLQGVESMLSRYIELSRVIRVAESQPTKEEKNEYYHLNRLRLNFERVRDAQQTNERWQERSMFKRVQAKFDSTSGDAEFESFWQTPQGLENNKHREARQLFLAILAEQTEDFTKPVFFGENFGENAEENIRNYPFIYNEWVKRVSGNEISNNSLTLEYVAERTNRLRAMEVRIAQIPDVEALVRAGHGTTNGFDITAYNSIRGSDAEVAKTRVEVLTNYAQNAKKKAGIARQNQKIQEAENLEDIAEDFESHIDLEEERAAYHNMMSQKYQLDQKFTASYFSKSSNQRMAIELAMLKFKRAMDTVDSPMGPDTEFRGQYHSTVRRTMIATLFRSGVSSYDINDKGELEYKENIGDRKAALMAALANSPHFNRSERGRFLSPEKRKALFVVQFGFEVINFIEDSQMVGEIMDLLEASEDPAKSEKEHDAAIRQLGTYPQQYVLGLKNSGVPIAQLKEKLATDRAGLQEYLDAAIELLKMKPEELQSETPSKKTERARKLLEQIENGELNVMLKSHIEGLESLIPIQGPELAEYDRIMHNIDTSYNQQEHVTNDQMKVFEHLGINIRGSYELYKHALEKPEFAKQDPPLTFDNWDEYRQDPKKFPILVAFIKDIIPESAGGGKEDFIEGLKATGRLNPADYIDPEKAKAHAVVLSVYSMLQAHLQKEETVSGEINARQKKIKRSHAGIDIGDIASNGIENAVDMLTGPGQPLSNRIAGGILLYTLYRVARKAIKGDDATAKLLRAGFVAAAVEVYMKDTKGEGLLEMAGIDPYQDAMEGTREGVLLMEGEKLMEKEKISQKEHERALQQMRDVPFHVLWEWHKNTTSSGELRNPSGSSKYKLPKGITASAILPGDKSNINKEERTSFILRKAMDNFITFVGNKDNEKGYAHGLNVLEERWITLIQNPNRKPKYSEFWDPQFADMFKDRNQLTWATVLDLEIGPDIVAETKGRTVAARAEKMVGEVWQGIGEWVDHHGDRVEGYAEEFFEGLGSAARNVSDGLGNLAEALNTKLYFTKEGVKAWYGAHEYEIKRIGQQHLELLKGGLSLVPKVIIGVDKFAMEWALTKIRQLNVIFSYQHKEQIEDKRDLALTDIVTADAAGRPNFVPNPAVNARYTYYKNFQRGFAEAFSNPSNHFFHEANDHIGYFISEVPGPGQTLESIGINPNNEKYKQDPANITYDLMEKSREAAIAKFVHENPNLSASEVGQYMYPIHTIDRTAEPPKLYMFWRMPMPGSAELHLRRIGEFADYDDPNRFGDREPFRIDPSEGKWGNFVRAMALDMGPARTVISSVGSYAIQIPRFALATIETLGAPIRWTAKKLVAAATADNPQEKRRIEQEVEDAMNKAFERPDTQKMWLDEIFASAGDETLALSDFYSDKLNAKLYAFSLKFAQENDMPMFTGLLDEGNTVNGISFNAAASPYGRPRGDAMKYYTKMLQYYNDIYSHSSVHGQDAEILSAINARIAAGGVPRTPNQRP